MGFFSFIQEIAMDLGTANTIIISDDKIVVDEPSVVALDRRTDKMIAVGEKAKMMYEKTHDNIRTIYTRVPACSRRRCAWSSAYLPALPRWSFVLSATLLSTPTDAMSI